MYNDYNKTSKVLNEGGTVTIRSHNISKYIKTLKWVTDCNADMIKIGNELFKLILKKSHEK